MKWVGGSGFGFTTLAAGFTIIIALFFGVSSLGQPATDSAQPPAPRLTATTGPSTNSATCAPIRQRGIGLLKDLETAITDADRAGLKVAIDDVRARGQGEADGYSAFAGASLLTGRYIPAAWGGLQALRREWRPEFVANAGVYLYHLDLLDDAEAFLACAREQAPRSPYVIEAQAMLALKRKNLNRAKESIELAVRLMPGDVNVHYNAAMIHRAAGDVPKALAHLRAADGIKPDDSTIVRALQVLDPAGDAKRRQRDALDRFSEECFAFMDEMLARARETSEFYNLMQRELLHGEWTENHGPFEEMRTSLAEDKHDIAEQVKAARGALAGKPDPFAWNNALFACADGYTETIEQFRHVRAGTAKVEILAAAQGMDPTLFAYRYALGGGQEINLIILDATTKFDQAIKPVRDDLERCTATANATVSGDATPCYRTFCGAAVPIWREYRSNVRSACRAAESGYPGAAEDYGNYWLAQVRRAANFSQRATQALKPTPLLPAAPMQTAESIAQMVQGRVTGTIELASMPLAETYDVLTRSLDAAPQLVISAAAGPPRGEFFLCPQDGPDDDPMDEKLDPFLEALKKASMVEYGWSVDCESKLGPFKANLKAKRFNDAQVTASVLGMQVRASAAGVEFGAANQVGGLTVTGNVRSDGRVGGDISYAQSAGGGAYGAVAKATVKISGRAANDGTMDFAAQLEGKIGGGLNFKGVEAACYPFSGRVTFSARAFAAAL